MTTTRTTARPHVLSASTLKGDAVKNLQNEDLGEIGNKLFAVPWSALTLDTDRHCFILNASKERLKNAPGFDKNDWPDMADPAWVSTVSRFYVGPASR